MRYFAGAVVWFALFAPLVATAAVFVSSRRSRLLAPEGRRRVAGLDVGVALTFLGVATVTLSPGSGGVGGMGSATQLVPFADMVNILTSSVSANVALRIVGMNIVLFAPLGFLLRLRLRRFAPAVRVGMLTSVAIEVLQAVLPLGRTANVDDVILNTAGATLGAAAAVAVVRIVRRRGRSAGEQVPVDAGMAV